MINEVEFDTKDGRMRGVVIRVNSKTVVVQVKTTKPRPIREFRGFGFIAENYRSVIVGWDKSEHTRFIKRHIVKHNVTEL